MPVRTWIGEVWRTTTARLTVFYGLIFALGILTLLGVVYWQSARYLNQRIDRILKARADVFMEASPADLPKEIAEGLAIDGAQINLYALFSRDGAPLVGGRGLHEHVRPGLEDAVDPVVQVEGRLPVDHAQQGQDADGEDQAVEQGQAGGGGAPDLPQPGPPVLSRHRSCSPGRVRS